MNYGNMPLANGLLTEKDLQVAESRYPLEILVCMHCYLVQLSVTISPSILFDNYVYFSSFSDAMVNSAKNLCERVVSEYQLKSSSRVLEIASNDGYLLQWYQKKGIPVLGIEPAKNICEVAKREKGIPSLCEFFDVDLAETLVSDGYQADVIHANNVMAHVPDINSFIEGIAKVLAPKGVCIIEVPYLIDMFERCEFDTVYHEHIFYFSITSLKYAFEKAKLVIRKAERISLHGGSIRLFISHGGVEDLSLLRFEAKENIRSLKYYLSLADNSRIFKERLIFHLEQIKKQHENIAAYGASAKGCVLLNHFGIGTETIDFVVDRSIHKQEKWIPGVRIPIVSPHVLFEKQPAYLLLLAWNFADEILVQQSQYRENGGKFLIPALKPYEV
jgi:2-polyprenyl-3-methyl-5-hydroxy-6-metoxy-1,4-benzoquinol methylase